MFPLRCRKDDLDLIHCPGNTAPAILSTGVPIVLTLHDTIFLAKNNLAPQGESLMQAAQNTYYRLVAPRAARIANQIITVSHFSKSDILSHIPGLTTPINVIHSGPGSSVAKIDDPIALERWRSHFKLDAPFVFTLGARDPRKNTPLVLQAFSDLVRTQDSRLKLVVAGLDPTTLEKLDTAAQTLGVRSRTRFLPFLSNEELNALYNLAEIFVFPSLYEGFGFPILEAMTCGTPVIAANNSASPEIAGDAALFFNARNANDLTSCLQRLTKNRVLRTRLAENGIQRSRAFSWAKAAHETMAIYELVGRRTINS